MYGTERKQNLARQKRGDLGSRGKPTGRRVTMCNRSARGEKGFSLIELVITITVMTILTMGIIPLVRVSVKRQKEQQLRDSLRQMRTAIDEFHRDTIGMVCTGTTATTQDGQQQPVQSNVFIDPRSKVVISDCTIFGVDNPDHYPPDIDILVNGVNVMPRSPASLGGRGLGASASDNTSTLSSQSSTKQKVYLRELPVDPMTGKKEWDFRSCYDPSDSTSWGGENVFDVRSKSRDRALNGEQYSDW
jgi:general secretion pathway protein G